jgi:hypothetical protein
MVARMVRRMDKKKLIPWNDEQVEVLATLLDMEDAGDLQAKAYLDSRWFRNEWLAVQRGSSNPQEYQNVTGLVYDPEQMPPQAQPPMIPSTDPDIQALLTSLPELPDD